MACRIVEGPQSVERQQRQACQARWSVIGRESSPASIGTLSIKQDLRLGVLVQAQGEKRQAGGFKRNLAGRRKEGPAPLRELAAKESPLQGKKERVLTTHRTLLRQSDTSRQKSAVLAPFNTHLTVVRSSMRSRRDFLSRHSKVWGSGAGTVKGGALGRRPRRMRGVTSL
jgi:hypothetical protein